MRVSKQEQEEIIALVREGYTLNSICVIMKNKTNGKEISQGDIVLISKKAGIKTFGKKEFNTKNAIKENLPNIAKDIEMMSKVKKTLIIISLCLLVLIGIIGYLWGIRPMIITACVVLLLITVCILFCYFSFIKGNRALKTAVQSKRRE